MDKQMEKRKKQHRYLLSEIMNHQLLEKKYLQTFFSPLLPTPANQKKLAASLQ